MKRKYFNGRSVQIWCVIGGASVTTNSISIYIPYDYELRLPAVAMVALLNVTVWTLLFVHGLNRGWLDSSNQKRKYQKRKYFNRGSILIWCAMAGAAATANSVNYIPFDYELWLRLPAVVMAMLLNVTVWTLLIVHGLNRGWLDSSNQKSLNNS